MSESHTGNSLRRHEVVPHNAWIDARKDLLAKENGLELQQGFFFAQPFQP